ncbi:unnamed protein product, partial [Penicillium palitans]
MDQDTCFKRLRKAFDERDQEVENLDQEVENLEQEVKKQQKQVQELQSKLLQQEDQHQEELSRRRILDCKICYRRARNQFHLFTLFNSLLNFVLHDAIPFT